MRQASQTVFRKSSMGKMELLNIIAHNVQSFEASQESTGSSAVRHYRDSVGHIEVC